MLRMSDVGDRIMRLGLSFPAALVLVILSAGRVHAITITASPNPATTGQAVAVNITAFFVGTVMCPLEVNFGDSALWSPAGTCGGGTCNLSVNHVYSTPGTFTLSARSQSCFPGPSAPDPATAVITVSAAQSLSASAAPSSFRIPRDAAAAQSVLYTLHAAVDATLHSPSGAFLAGGTVIGAVNVPLTAVTAGGRGAASETVTIPAAVINRALALRTTRISYVRTFTDGAASATATTEAVVSSAAGADFSIKRIRLSFDNNRSEITVKKGRSPQVHAELSYYGSGLLRGFWEVDGRMLGVVSEHLAFGGAVVLSPPAASPLPAFDTGSHRVRLVITAPPLDMNPPEALYYVADDAAENGKLLIVPVSPDDGAVLEYASMDFRWTDAGRSTGYVLEVFNAGNSRPVLSAHVRTPHYALPRILLSDLFVPGGRYTWKVTGWDRTGNSTGASRERGFSFK